MHGGRLPQRCIFAPPCALNGKCRCPLLFNRGLVVNRRCAVWMIRPCRKRRKPPATSSFHVPPWTWRSIPPLTSSRLRWSPARLSCTFSVECAPFFLTELSMWHCCEAGLACLVSTGSRTPASCASTRCRSRATPTRAGHWSSPPAPTVRVLSILSVLFCNIRDNIARLPAMWCCVAVEHVPVLPASANPN